MGKIVFVTDFFSLNVFKMPRSQKSRRKLDLKLQAGLKS